jgi:Zn-dependent peptidase ImmA (M78 family)
MSRHAHQANLSPKVLKWAVKRVEVSVADLARAVGTGELAVTQWLEGESSPTFRQAKALATRLRLPFGYLFLPTPPPEELPIPDFRRVAGSQVATASVDLRDVVLAVMRRQDWLSEFLREAHAEPVEVVAQARDSESDIEVAANIRTSLKLTGSARPGNAEALLRDLVQRVEALRVNVLRSGIVGNNTHRPLRVDEFRGFALSDEFAPFIFINGVDAPQAQAFTLIHELAHIWRGDSGISGNIEEGSDSAEVFCNRVAAEVLVPAAEFREFWSEDLPIKDAVRQASQHFRISRYVVAIRAFESGLLGRTTLMSLLDEYRSESGRDTSRSGGDFYKTLIARNGRAFTSTVVDAVTSQRVLVRDAASLLEARPAQLPRLGRELSSVE